MNSRWMRYLVVSLLGLIALDGALNVYISFSLGYMMRDLLRGLGVRAGNPIFGWDVWFSGAIAAFAVVAMVEIWKRKSLAKPATLAVVGASFFWASALTLLPDAQIHGLFSITIDRIPAACAAAIFLVTLVLASRMNYLSRVQ